MEAGSPHARYAVITNKQRRFAVEHVAIAYDHETAAATAERNGRPDWALALRSGRAS
jgi:hypothetical protein